MKNANPWALIPFIVFLVLFIGSGIITGDFYNFPVIVAITIAAGVALAMNRRESLTKKVDIFCKGAGNANVMLMVIIFILAGAFSEVAKGMGAVESAVNLTTSVVPQNLLVVGLFVIACFISLSMGTSVGSIVALAPIGVGISDQTSLSMALVMGAIVGGSMFGDNLSFISDTTITAVRTQGAQMKDKFKVNFWIVLPAAIVTSIILGFLAMGESAQVDHISYNWIKIVPYVLVIVFALIGMNVFLVLVLGIVLAGAVGLIDGSYHFMSLMQQIGDGMAGMYEIAFLAILIAGMVEIIKFNGGIDYILHLATRRIKTKKGAEFSIAGLVSLTDVSTANNTISILITGPLAKNIADQYGIEPRKSASILDLFSCSIQGLLPYGAQLLTAATVAGISPISIIPYSFYPIMVGICGIIAILIGYPKKKNTSGE
ncbi:MULTISPECIES: Na+/H+ antiporter NhaC family protein [Terribacillus]|uniref:Sodium:proton antiporter n=2 Tax=Terribacillus saccharophilus TaxID=361277 RepID=A0ABX4H1L5_9BACI|nr:MULTISPECIES: Na+/H+ antiporter NhaC family protein [Terribacillus]PAD36654.1 sodium:proton antiporter [Terribacillus saccharophilus]PAD97636.1 sodium:proton antiporter [Terribacillus saccharophilus]PAE01018.1 sodium:proton antiporter [Terribacillus saccharophilus]